MNAKNNLSLRAEHTGPDIFVLHPAPRGAEAYRNYANKGDLR